jgi:hypothetical protein
MNEMELYRAYVKRFGEMPDSLRAPNWLFQTKGLSGNKLGKMPPGFCRAARRE